MIITRQSLKYSSVLFLKEINLMKLLDEPIKFFLSIIKIVFRWCKKIYYSIKKYLFNPVDAEAKIESGNKIILRFWSDYFRIKFLKANITTTDKNVILFVEKSEFGTSNINLKHPLLDCIGTKKCFFNNNYCSNDENFCVIQVEIYYKILILKRRFKQNLIVDEKDWR